MMIHHLAASPEGSATPLVAGRTLVEFYARWCGTCRALSRTLHAVEHAIGLPIVAVDIDDDPVLARRFDVLSIPQLIYLVDGREHGRVGGSLDETEFATWFASVSRTP